MTEFRILYSLNSSVLASDMFKNMLVFLSTEFSRIYKIPQNRQ